MIEIWGRTVDANCLLAAFVFVAHIVGNVLVSGPSQGGSVRVDKLSLFPPFWVFGIWVVIWGLQSALLFQSTTDPYCPDPPRKTAPRAAC